eukprot:5184328-Amphidinium_carterae.1
MCVFIHTFDCPFETKLELDLEARLRSGKSFGEHVGDTASVFGEGCGQARAFETRILLLLFVFGNIVLLSWCSNGESEAELSKEPCRPVALGPIAQNLENCGSHSLGWACSHGEDKGSKLQS